MTDRISRRATRPAGDAPARYAPGPLDAVADRLRELCRYPAGEGAMATALWIGQCHLRGALPSAPRLALQGLSATASRRLLDRLSLLVDATVAEYRGPQSLVDLVSDPAGSPVPMVGQADALFAEPLDADRRAAMAVLDACATAIPPLRRSVLFTCRRTRRVPASPWSQALVVRATAKATWSPLVDDAALLNLRGELEAWGRAQALPARTQFVSLVGEPPLRGNAFDAVAVVGLAAGGRWVIPAPLMAARAERCRRDAIAAEGIRPGSAWSYWKALDARTLEVGVLDASDCAARDLAPLAETLMPEVQRIRVVDRRGVVVDFHRRRWHPES